MPYQPVKQFEIDALPINLQPMREVLRRVFVEHHIAKKIADEMVIALNEACMNIIEHAYKGKKGVIQINIKKNTNQWCFELTDFAPPVDIKSIRAKDLAEVRPGGLGVNFLYQIMDSVKYENISGEQTGNRLLLTKEIKQENKDGM